MAASIRLGDENVPGLTLQRLGHLELAAVEKPWDAFVFLPCDPRHAIRSCLPMRWRRLNLPTPSTLRDDRGQHHHHHPA